MDNTPNNLRSYHSLRERAVTEFIEKKSRFISCAAPVATQEEALAVIAQIRAEHPRASHNVWAYSLREDNTARFSDDGEPSGTAGMPTLEVIKKSGLVDTVCVTTRYFGGIMLGAAGLLRTYSHSAKLALDLGGILLYDIFCDVLLECGYSDYQKIQPLMDNYKLAVLDTKFAESVVVEVRVLWSDYDRFHADMVELTNGRASILMIDEGLHGI